MYVSVLYVEVTSIPTRPVDNVFITKKGPPGGLVLRIFLRSEKKMHRSVSVSRLQKIPNTTIRSKMQAEQSILDRIQRRQLKWYGHLLRMEDSHWPKKIY